MQVEILINNMQFLLGELKIRN